MFLRTNLWDTPPLFVACPPASVIGTHQNLKSVPKDQWVIA